MPQTKSKEPGIILRDVSRTVSGRQRSGNRVTYEWRGRRGATERIVVWRCRAADYRAFRLPPSIWRTLAELETLEEQNPAVGLEEILKQLDVPPSSRPSPELVQALRAGVLPRRLRALMERHTSGEVSPSHPGVPDLFVFKERNDGSPYAVRFVEVKRRGKTPERLAPHQRDEIEFMRKLGLKAGVLRLEERPARRGQ